MNKNFIQILLIFVFGLFSNFLLAQGPTLSIYYNVGTTVEGSSETLHLVLSTAISTPVVVNITTQADTAGDSDFIPLNTTMTIPAGQTVSANFNVTAIDDSIIEQFETIFVKASVISSNTSNNIAYRIVGIIDNDSIPSVVGPITKLVYEGYSSNSISFVLSNIYNSDVVINYATTNGTAGTSDFTALNSTITIPRGQTSVSIPITITDDTFIESDETFLVTGTITSGNTTNTNFTSTVKIVDNDTAPNLILSSYLVSEGQSATINASLDRPYNSDVIINFTTVTGTAGNGDFAMTNVSQTILAGAITTSFSIFTVQDNIDEPTETFTVNANVISGNTANLSESLEVKISDNDGLPDLSISKFLNPGFNGQEGGLYEGDTQFFNLDINDNIASDVILHIVTTPGTASNTDFIPLDTFVTIPAGETRASVSVPTIYDGLVEGTENFNLTATVTSGNVFNSSESLVIDILDNYNLLAIHDEFSFVVGTANNLSVIANDTYHGAAVNPNDVSLSLQYNSMGVTLDSQGILHVPNSIKSGTYQLRYTAREVANPLYFVYGTITLTVSSPLALTYTSAYQDFNGDGYVSAGDVFNVAFSLNNIGNAPLTNIRYRDLFTNDVVPLGGPLASLTPGTTDSSTFTVRVIIKQSDINNGFVNFSTYFLADYYFSTFFVGISDNITINASDGIKLVAFIDSNNNGVKDGVEPYFTYGNFHYSINSGTSHDIYCESSYYLYESNPNTVYNLSYNIDAYYSSYNTCPAAYSNITIPTGSGITTYYFPITTTSYSELSTYIMPWTNPKPGMTWYNFVRYKNNSNVTVPSGTLTYTKDPAVTITNISQPGVVTNLNGFTYNFTNIAPFETRYINVELLVPSIPSVALGQLLSSSVSVTLQAGDIYPYNNNSEIIQPVVGSFDPNDINESHGERILHSSFTSNDYLTYTIRFENTGTANAINIKIEDVLDNKLDPSTIRILGSSYPYVMERIGANLTWKFNAINLPPSIQDTMIGKGYITFQVKPKPGYAVGDVIPNLASIYFDTNPAIVTNTFNTRFVNSLSNEDFVFGDLSYFPNPIDNILNLSNGSMIDEVSITSILGQQILNKKINSFQTEIDLSQFLKGIYFVKVSSGTLEKTIKVIKK